MNRLGQDLHGRVVVLSAAAYKGDEAARRFLCLSGFGCKASSVFVDGHGRRIDGVFLVDGERASVHGADVEAIAADQDAGVTPELRAEADRARRGR